MLNATIWNVRGLNKRDHQLALKDVATECLVSVRALHTNVIITVVYGNNEIAERRELWRSLGVLAGQCVDDPWIVGEDFNAVRDLSEGEWYTWHNRISNSPSFSKRLDQMLINNIGLERFPNSYYSNLTPRTSNHSPLVLYGDRQQQLGGMFRSDNYLTLSPDFIPSVQNVWKHDIIGVPMYAITQKLKVLEPVFRQQRRNKGDLSENVRLAKGFLEEA
ncbi:UNVERIFIED_CONTAM: hypothetical protein Sindi_1705500 [Sesamum indicum]